APIALELRHEREPPRRIPPRHTRTPTRTRPLWLPAARCPLPARLRSTRRHERRHARDGGKRSRPAHHEVVAIAHTLAVCVIARPAARPASPPAASPAAARSRASAAYACALPSKSFCASSPKIVIASP